MLIILRSLPYSLNNSSTVIPSSKEFPWFAFILGEVLDDFSTIFTQWILKISATCVVSGIIFPLPY